MPIKRRKYTVRKRTWPGPHGSKRIAYQADFRDPVTGIRKRQNLESEKLADAWDEAHRIYQHRLELASAAELPTATAAESLTLEILLERHSQRLNIEESTRITEEIQTRNIVRFSGPNLLARAIGNTWIDDFISWRRKKPMPGRSKPATDATILKEIKLIRQAMRWGSARHYCADPTWKIPRLSPIKTKSRCLTESELQALLAHVGSDDSTLRQIVELLYLTGLRRSEFMNLKWGDIDLLNAKIVLITKKGGTAGDRREDTIFLPPRAIKLLKRRVLAITGDSEARIKPSEYVFRDARVKSVKNFASLNSLNKVISRHARDAGIRNPDEIGVHTLRHTCATHLLNARATAPEAAAHLRHRDGGALLLKTYAHAHEAGLRSATERLVSTLPDTDHTDTVDGTNMAHEKNSNSY